MSYSAETTYYGLPLPTGSDKSTFTDNNTAFQAVDAALHTAAEGAAQAAEDITSLTSRVGTAEDDIDALELDLGTEKGKIEALQNKETLQDAAIDDVRSDCEGMVSAYNEPTATSTHAYVAGDYFIYNDVLYQATDAIAIGDTIVPNTNCSTTTVSEELAEVNGDISQLNNDLAGSDGIIATGIEYHTTGDLVVLDFHHNGGPFAANSWTDWITLTASLRPNVTVHSVVQLTDGTDYTSGIVQVNTDGKIQVFNPSAISAGQIYGQVAIKHIPS